MNLSCQWTQIIRSFWQMKINFWIKVLGATAGSFPIYFFWLFHNWPQILDLHPKLTVYVTSVWKHKCRSKDSFWKSVPSFHQKIWGWIHNNRFESKNLSLLRLLHHLVFLWTFDHTMRKATNLMFTMVSRQCIFPQ